MKKHVPAARSPQRRDLGGVTVADFPAWERRTRVTQGPASARNRGQHGRRILSTFVRDGHQYELHATKGIRRYLLSKSAA